MTTASLRPARFFIGVILLAVTLQARAAFHFVGVDGSGFLPANLNIKAGDTVTWINLDEVDSHTTTSDLQFPHPDAWHAILFDLEDTFAKTFNNPGTFTYRDLFDNGNGTIVVVPGNQSGLELASPRMVGGQLLFEATGLEVGREIVLEFSTNLVHWTALNTNLADNSAVTFTNGIHPGARFFRVSQLP
jgi:plastocyanin